MIFCFVLLFSRVCFINVKIVLSLSESIDAEVPRSRVAGDTESRTVSRVAFTGNLMMEIRPFEQACAT